ncbi:hypothetical protein [Mitsuaria sp. GD03876]|uniref:hypothetical protein n=1 Tax=Mitsuaria sp. GD03876 TaxID=2975399 RepID=UPI002448CD23|nr:hypothetical protein [Mitsuaria sp. GD03876]MDH0866240.1 hypothetical protein [Mitsuaria sp. GD03876]
MIDDYLAESLRQAECPSGAKGSDPATSLSDELLRWALGATEGDVVTPQGLDRLHAALTLHKAERGQDGSVTIEDARGDAGHLIDLPPKAMLARSRLCRDHLPLLLRVHNDRVRDPRAFAASLGASHRTMLFVDRTQFGQLPHGTAVPRVHGLWLNKLEDDGDDLRHHTRAFRKDLFAMPQLADVYAPASWNTADDVLGRTLQQCKLRVHWVLDEGVEIASTKKPGRIARAVQFMRSASA